MHPTLLVVKRSEAITRIERAARRIVELAQVDPSLVDALTSTGNHPQVRELRKLEAIADILDASLAEAGDTAVTESPALADTLPPEGMHFTESSPAVLAQNVQVEESAVQSDDAPDLPPPSLAEEPSAKSKRSRK